MAILVIYNAHKSIRCNSYVSAYLTNCDYTLYINFVADINDLKVIIGIPVSTMHFNLISVLEADHLCFFNCSIHFC